VKVRKDNKNSHETIDTGVRLEKSNRNKRDGVKALKDDQVIQLIR